MNREAINPNDMYNAVQFGFSHAVKNDSGQTIHCAGQVAWDDNGDLVGAGDLAAQVAQCLRNLKKVLAHAGARPQDIVRLRTYVVDHSPEKLETICSAIGAFYEGEAPAANTLIGVQTLALPDFLIEIEATAVIN